MNKPYFFTWTDQSNAFEFESVRSNGCYYYLNNGKKIFDGISTSFQASFGHSDLNIKNNIHKWLDLMPIASPKASYDFKNQQTERFLKHIGFKGKIFYTVSGAESVENALKFARQYRGQNLIACRKKSYHGATLGALSVTGDWRNLKHATISDWTLRIPEPEDDYDGEKTEKLIREVGPEKIAAFCLETISGTNGVSIPSEVWWKKIQKICDETGILLILDEVFVGFGRTGKKFAYNEWSFLKPDLICFSKAISGGYIPFGAVFVNEKISKKYDQDVLCFGLTSYAHPLGLAALECVLDRLESEEFWMQVKKGTQKIESELNKFNGLENFHQYRHRGYLAALVFKERISDPKKFFENIFNSGVYVFVNSEYLIVAPPLVSTMEDIEVFFEILRKNWMEF